MRHFEHWNSRVKIGKEKSSFLWEKDSLLPYSKNVLFFIGWHFYSKTKYLKRQNWSSTYKPDHVCYHLRAWVFQAYMQKEIDPGDNRYVNLPATLDLQNDHAPGPVLPRNRFSYFTIPLFIVYNHHSLIVPHDLKIGLKIHSTGFKLALFTTFCWSPVSLLPKVILVRIRLLTRFNFRLIQCSLSIIPQ